MFLPSPMTEEQLKALLKMVKGDTSLQEKFKAAASPDAAVEIAKDAGFAITAITIFFFAVTIIGPHTPVQANYYQGCNEECKEAERRSAEMMPKALPDEPRIPNPSIPRIKMPSMEPTKMRGMPSMEPTKMRGMPSMEPMEMPEGPMGIPSMEPMEMPRGIGEFPDMEPMEKPILEPTKMRGIPSIEPTEMPSFESISPDSPFGETCTPGSVLCDF